MNICMWWMHQLMSEASMKHSVHRWAAKDLTVQMAFSYVFSRGLGLFRDSCASLFRLVPTFLWSLDFSTLDHITTGECAYCLREKNVGVFFCRIPLEAVFLPGNLWHSFICASQPNAAVIKCVHVSVCAVHVCIKLSKGGTVLDALCLPLLVSLQCGDPNVLCWA